jgi:autotransporter-associated beta strand protein
VALAGFNQTTAGLRGNGTIDFGNVGTNVLTVSSLLDSTFAGSLTGAGKLAKAGDSTLTLSHANTFGGVTVNEGTVQLAATQNVGSVSIASGAKVVLSSGGGNDTMMAGAGIDKLIGSRGNDLLMGEDAVNLYSIADGTRDDFDGTVGTSGRSFVSGDPGVDFSTKTGTFI